MYRGTNTVNALLPDFQFGNSDRTGTNLLYPVNIRVRYN